jgi:tetratricopeptide (TPR) repeat protein
MIEFFVSLALLLAALYRLCFANRGMIPFRPNIKIFEPKQRVLIAWNGEEEILLLSTDLRASEPTQVLEVLPLAAEPEVKEGDLAAFERVTELINRYIREGSAVRSGRGLGLEEEVRRPAGEVTFHEQIGAHDISVTHVLRGEGFVEWVEGYLRSAGVESPTLPEGMREIVHDYIAGGYTWFVFDVVSLEREPKTNQPIQYRFKTPALFYPLKITSLAEGDTSVEILAFVPGLLTWRWEPEQSSSWLYFFRQPRRETIMVSAEDLAWVSEEMADLLQHEEASLEVWQLEGSLSSLNEDLVLYGELPTDEDRLRQHRQRAQYLLEIRQYEGAERELEKALALTSGRDYQWAMLRYDMAILFYEQGRYEPAAAELEQVLALLPGMTAAWQDKGKALSALGRHEEALSCFDQALALASNDASSSGQILILKGETLTAMGRCEEAITGLDRALEIDPKNRDAWYAKGMAFARLKRYDRALDSLEKARKLHHRQARQAIDTCRQRLKEAGE